jgi:hypothetical protein
MAKRKRRKLSEKEALKHYTPCEGAPPSSRSSAPSSKIQDQIQASKPTFIKAVVAIDNVLAGRKSAVIGTTSSKPEKRREHKDGKDAKDE